MIGEHTTNFRMFPWLDSILLAECLSSGSANGYGFGFLSSHNADNYGRVRS